MVIQGESNKTYQFECDKLYQANIFAKKLETILLTRLLVEGNSMIWVLNTSFYVNIIKHNKLKNKTLDIENLLQVYN